MELFLLRGTSFVESVADGFVQDCSHVSREGEQNRKQCFWNRNTKQNKKGDRTHSLNNATSGTQKSS